MPNESKREGIAAFIIYLFTPFAIIDLISSLPSIGLLHHSLRILRMLRIFKVLHYSKSFVYISNVFTNAHTTVGYGDVYPLTRVGQFISMISSLLGIAIIALPAGVITGGFMEEISIDKTERAVMEKAAEIEAAKAEVAEHE